MTAADDERVDIVLEEVGARLPAVVDFVRSRTLVNAEDARKLVTRTPVPIITNVRRTQAEALKIELEALGAIVGLRPFGGGTAPTDLTDHGGPFRERQISQTHPLATSRWVGASIAACCRLSTCRR